MRTVGIDLGTSNTVCCYADHEIVYVPLHSQELLPSCLLYLNGEITIGERAKKRGHVYFKNIIQSSKTYIADEEKVWTIEDRAFTPTDVAAEILKVVRVECEKYFQTTDMISAVITIPAYFSPSQRRETKLAAQNAGFEVMNIISEPVAAAIAYGFDNEDDCNLFIIDLGGGTFDVCAMHVKNGHFETLYPAGGDKRLGGDDFTEVICELCYKEIRMSCGLDLSDLGRSGLDGNVFLEARKKLMTHSERAKIELSDVESTEINIPNLLKTGDRTINFSHEITKEDFISASEILLNKIKRIIRGYMDDAGLETSDIDKVILVGGSSNIPVIREYVKGYFSKEPYADKDLAKLVAKGAAIAALQKGKGIIAIKDKLSHSLGIKIIKNGYSKLLNRGDEFPTKSPVAKMYTTAHDYQKRITVAVFEGEDEKDVFANHYYGGFVLKDIQVAKRGVPNIEVSFSFDEDSILHVTARDLATGSSQKKEIGISAEKRIAWEEPPQKVCVYFVIDVTGSMNPYIEGVKDTCHQFANTISQKCDDLALGLIVYGDEEIGEQPVMYDLTSDIDRFKEDVSGCPNYYGGDEPESSFEAVSACIKHFTRTDCNKTIVLITDASAHSPRLTSKGRFDSTDILHALTENNITTFVVGPDQSYYKQFACETGGSFYEIEEYQRFVEIINQIAVEISALTLK